MNLRYRGAARRYGAALAAGLLAVGQPALAAETASVVGDEGDPDESTRRMVHWNEYEGRWFTARLGGGFLYDSANYSQDAQSESQFQFDPEAYIRDSRLLLKGRLKFSPRLKYTIGYMYDPAPEKRTWYWRQTGIYVDLPEWGGDLFIGRTKEGISMNKIMVGYNGWTNERATANDAFIPILADGIQLRGSVPGRGFAWNLGLYDDEFTESESFNKNDNQFVARGVWQPLHDKSEDILHFGLAYRYGTDEDGQVQYKSRPESFSAPFVIDTGAFAVDHTQTVGLEAYYQRGSRRILSEPEHRPTIGRSLITRRRGHGDLAHQRRAPPVQPEDRRLRRDRAGQLRFRRWPRHLGIRGAVFIHRPGGRRDRGRQVLALHAHGQLAHVAQRAPRDRLRLRRARQIRDHRWLALLPDPHPAPALIPR
jgi:phosphate-selective porin